MRVALVFGGKSVEHAVSVRSAKTVFLGLREARHDVVAVGIAEDGTFQSHQASVEILSGELKQVPSTGTSVVASLASVLPALDGIDAVFPIVHGTFGEDGTLQGLLAMLDVAYVGCDVTASAVAMDKLLSKQIFERAGIPVVPYAAVHAADFSYDKDVVFQATKDITGPWFVKPSVGGSSVGCGPAPTAAALVSAVAHALKFDDVALIEKSVNAREVEVAVLGQAGAMKASVLGEIVPGAAFYDYADKYLKDDAQLLAPAPVTPEQTTELQTLALRAMTAIGGSGMARVDFFVGKKDGSIALNEINTLPGFTSVSMYPRLWGLSGLSLKELINRLVNDAVARHRAQQAISKNTKAFVASVVG